MYICTNLHLKLLVNDFLLTIFWNLTSQVSLVIEKRVLKILFLYYGMALFCIYILMEILDN